MLLSVFYSMATSLFFRERVDIFGIVIAAAAYCISEEDQRWNANADLDKEGRITVFDLVIAADNYCKSR